MPTTFHPSVWHLAPLAAIHDDFPLPSQPAQERLGLIGRLAGGLGYVVDTHRQARRQGGENLRGLAAIGIAIARAGM